MDLLFLSSEPLEPGSGENRDGDMDVKNRRWLLTADRYALSEAFQRGEPETEPRGLLAGADSNHKCLWSLMPQV